MLLAVDVGNTHTVIGLYEPGAGLGSAESGLVEHWRLSTNHERTSDEYGMVLSEFLRHRGFSLEEHVTGLIVSSVVPRVTQAFREMGSRYFELDVVVVETGVRTGMPILYENPREVGADRIANAVGAYDLFGGPCVVVDFGTATTFDAISGKGEYLGGAILPGVDISVEALFARAAGLRRTELIEPGSPIGRTTAESIRSGVLFGTASAIDGLTGRIADEIGKPTVVATGGLSTLIAPLTKTIDHVEPWLTLHGLRLIHAKNAPRD